MSNATQKNLDQDLVTLSLDTLASAAGGIGGKSYSIEKGDNLSTIAKKNGTTVANLLELNPGFKKNPNLIRPGEYLLIEQGQSLKPSPANS